MGEESEKRFQAVMDKLFHAPNPRKSLPNSNSGNQSSRSVKRPNTGMYSSALMANSRSNLVSGSGQPPLCRPWDRGDLMKRLATFKSMTWFAKPQVVNAVNCARRGWINVDADTIACESCGARLFFSTPSAWMQHQVEKAALVFSLKLDGGHKLLCPWIDNSCDETLARFPPMQAEVLVDEYKKRFSALMHLLALPVISSSAIERMKSPLLTHFLEESADFGCSNESTGIYCPEDLGNNGERMFSRSYHEAQKLISLCGWEPRLLPYVVDCKNQQNESSRDGKGSNGHSSSLIVYSSGKEATTSTNNDSIASEKYDPCSVVLECRLCGASVGLWAFSTVPQPLELLRLVGYTRDIGVRDDSDNPKESSADVVSVSLDNSQSTNCSASTSAIPSTERRSSLNLTIAGGPPPTKQNFKATISLPVIGRNLRARFSSDPDFRDRLCAKNAVLEGTKRWESNITGISLQPEDMGASLETSALVSIVEEPPLNAPSLVDSSSKDDMVPEKAEDIGRTNAKVGGSNISQAEDCSTCADLIITNGKNIEGDDLTTAEPHIFSDLSPISDSAIVCSAPGDCQDGNGTAQTVNDAVRLTKRGKNSGQLPAGEGMGFDPIGQHRSFCSWIASANNSLPGWKQVISALHRQHEFSCPSGATDASSSSLIEVDDPITSIRKLFTPPSAKRTKLVHNAS